MKFALASRCLSVAEMGNAENSFKIIPMLPVFWRPGVLFISARLRPSGDTKSMARLAVCADTKSTVGCGLQAAELALMTASRSMSLPRCRGAVAFRQASPVHRTMPGKRVLPTVTPNFQGDYAEGLGQYPTGLSPRR
jgi:hypothetical protein